MVRRVDVVNSIRNAVLQRQSEKLSGASRHQLINVYLTAISTVGLLVAAVVQISVSMQQTALMDASTKLQLAQSKPRIELTPSKSEVQVHQSINKENVDVDVSIPSYFTMKIVSGVDEISIVNSAVKMIFFDKNGNNPCDVQIRGIYVENDKKDVLQVLPPVVSDLSKLLSGFSEKDLTFFRTSVGFVVTYVDLYGNLRIEEHNGQRFAGDDEQKGLILYSGLWSGGQGFYLDEYSTPELECPELTNEIRNVIESLGGKPGPL